MTRFSLVLAVLCTIFALHCVAGRAQRQPSRISAGCIKNGVTYSAGEKFTVPGECNQYTCNRNGGISAVTCSESRFPPGSPCSFSAVDLTKTYPKCCPQPVCPPGYKP